MIPITASDSLLREMETKSDDELKKISLERGGRYNRYTKQAIAAQIILHDRSGCFSDYGRTITTYKLG